MSRGFGRGCPMARQLSDINSWSRKEQKAKKKKKNKTRNLTTSRTEPTAMSKSWADVTYVTCPCPWSNFFFRLLHNFLWPCERDLKNTKKKKEQFVLCVTDQGHFYSAKRVLKLPWRRWIIISQRPSAIQSLSNDFFKECLRMERNKYFFSSSSSSL